MDKSTKSATISQLIEMLNEAKAKYGDREVVLSSDPEGNSFGTIDIGGASVNSATENGFELLEDAIIIYPFEQFTDF